MSGANTLIPFHFPTATLAYFQFVFAAITPLLFCGSVLGRMKFKAWLLFVPLWTTFVYAVNAKLLWGGGFLAAKGAVDFSGGYVIHMSAGVSGFVAAAIVGPRLLRDRQHGVPNNLMMVAVGAGILWLGWNGFNGGDPYYAGADAAAAVINTNIATAVGLLPGCCMDWWFSKPKKPTFLGAINGMICGLVGITPSAGWVDGYGAIIVGLICSRRRLGGLELPVQGQALLQGRRRPRGRLHPRHRRLLGRPAGRVPGRSGHDRVRRDRQDLRGHPAASAQLRAGSTGILPPAVGAVPGRRVGHLLVRGGDRHPSLHRQVRLSGLAREGRDARDRRRGLPR